MAAAQSLYFTLFGCVAAYNGRVQNRAASTMCLDIENHHHHYDPHNIPVPTQVQLWQCNEKWNQDWKFSEGNPSKIMSSHTSKTSEHKCLAIESGSAVPTLFDKVKLEDCSKAPTWDWNSIAGTFQLVAKPSLCLGICFDHESCGCSDGNLHCGHGWPDNYAIAHLTHCNGDKLGGLKVLTWDLPGPVPLPARGWGFRNPKSRRCLDIENHLSQFDPSNIATSIWPLQAQLWDCNHKWNQHWDYHTGSKELFSTQTEHPSWTKMCLGSSTSWTSQPAPGSLVMLFKCSQKNNVLKWNLQSITPGIIQIQLDKPGKTKWCLTIDDGSSPWHPRHPWPQNYARATIEDCAKRDSKYNQWEYKWDLSLVNLSLVV